MQGTAIDSKRFYRAVLVILLVAVCSMQLPYTNNSIVKILIPTIKVTRNSRLHLSGLLTLIPLIWSYNEIIKSRMYRDKFLVALCMIIIIPMLFEYINVIKVPYYKLNKGLKTIDVVKSNIDLEHNSQNKTNLNLQVELKNYDSIGKEFYMSVILPEELQNIVVDKKVKFKKKYAIMPDGEKTIEGVVGIIYKEGYTYADIHDIHFIFENYYIVLENGENTNTIRICD